MDLTGLKSKVSAENPFLTFLTSRSCLHCLVGGHVTLTSDSIVMSFLTPPFPCDDPCDSTELPWIISPPQGPQLNHICKDSSTSQSNIIYSQVPSGRERGLELGEERAEDTHLEVDGSGKASWRRWHLK